MVGLGFSLRNFFIEIEEGRKRCVRTRNALPFATMKPVWDTVGHGACGQWVAGAWPMEKRPRLALMGWRWRGLVGWIARRWKGGEMVVRELRGLGFVLDAREGMMVEARSGLVKCMVIIELCRKYSWVIIC